MSTSNATLEEVAPPRAAERNGGRGRAINVGPSERMISTALGGLLIAWGLRKRSMPGVASALLGSDLVYRGVTGHCNVYGMLHVDTARAHRYGSEIALHAVEVSRAITIGRSPEELYAFWRDPHNLARVVGHFAEVTQKPDGLLHWRMQGPLKQMLEWDCRLTDESPGRRLAWESVPGSTFVNRGEITFSPAPGSVGSEVRLRVEFEPLLPGRAGAKLAKAFRKVPRAIAGETLRRFKSLMETGEIPTLEKNPSCRGAGDRV